MLISNDQGEAVAYALWNLEDRGPMMIEPGWKVYRGMIVGEHTRGNDLEVNVLKGKKLTNIRTHAKDEAVRLTPPIRMTLEKALAYIEDDELVEVTPKSIRLRKKLLDPNERKREERRKEAAGGGVVPFCDGSIGLWNSAAGDAFCVRTTRDASKRRTFDGAEARDSRILAAVSRQQQHKDTIKLTRFHGHFMRAIPDAQRTESTF